VTSQQRDLLPLSATPAFIQGEWSVGLPVRADEINVTKRVVVYERVVVRRQQVEGREHVQTQLLREQLRMSKSDLVEPGERDAETSD